MAPAIARLVVVLLLCGVTLSGQVRWRFRWAPEPPVYVDALLSDANAGSATPDCTTYDPGAFACGTGAATAYATLADVNAVTKTPGMTFLFRRGQTFAGVLTVSQSGTAGRPIALAAYGSGARPIIDGMGVEANGVVQAFAQSYLTVDGLHVTNGANGIWLAGAGGHHIVLDTEASANTYDGVLISGSTDAQVLGGSSHDNGRAGVGFYAGADRSTVTGIEVYNNAEGLGDTDAGGGVVWYQVSGGTATNVIAHDNLYGLKTFDPATSNITITGCHAYDNTWFGVDFDFAGSGMVVEKCLLHGNIHGIAVEGTTPGAVVRWNRTTGNGTGEGACGIEVSEAPDTIVSYNVMLNERNAFCAFYDPDGLRLWNNTMAGATDACVNAAVANANPDDWQLTNNIGSGCGGYVLHFGVWAVTNLTAATNVWYHTGPTVFARRADGDLSLASWQALGVDTASANSDPLFDNLAGGVVSIGSGSPAENTGTSLGASYQTGLVAGSSWPLVVLTGNQATWDIGAYMR